jgi:hypothetical protein
LAVFFFYGYGRLKTPEPVATGPGQASAQAGERVRP